VIVREEDDDIWLLRLKERCKCEEKQTDSKHRIGEN
jgi:hypothetical protein